MPTPIRRSYAHIGFWFAVLTLMAAVTWTLYDSKNNVDGSLERVEHTQAVLLELADINEAVNRADSAQRSFMLSEDANYHTVRDEALTQITEAIGRTRALMADDAAQTRRLAQLEALVSARVVIMQESATQSRIQTSELQNTPGTSSMGTDATARIYLALAEIRHEELQQLKARTADADAHQTIETAILVAALLISMLILIPGYFAYQMQARARAQTERKLRIMADALPGAMYQLTHDPTGAETFTFVSAGATNLFGLTPADLRDWPSLLALMDERDRPGVAATMELATQTLAPVSIDYRIKRGDDDLVWLHHEASFSREYDGSLEMNGYIQDISRQRHLEDALQAAKEIADSANSAKSMFLATMSHEIRTPMNAVLGMLELLGLTKLNDEQHGLLVVVRESSKSLLRIVDDILDFSRIEAGKLEIRPDVASIRNLVKNLRNSYSGNASAKGLAISYEVDPRISPALVVDSLRLRQILNNFVSNALKFTEKGEIEIKAELVGRANGLESLRFVVHDTGIGISEDAKTQIFHSYSQGDANTQRRDGGTGLGLAICKRIAELLGGSIDVISRAGEGTSMLLTLTLKIANPDDLPHADPERPREFLSTTMSMRRMAPSTDEAVREGTLVLVVDDHPTNRQLIALQVRTLGYAADTADNGAAALAAWNTGRYSMIFTDCNMPEMDGYALARSIRSIEAGRGAVRVPIVAFTATALSGHRETCISAGMDDCLVKPVNLSQILRSLDKWLPIPRQSSAAPAPAPSPALADAAREQSPIDRLALAEISHGNTTTEHEILVDFRLANDGDAAVLLKAVAAGDTADVAHLAHRILGACRMVGAHALAGVCTRLSEASRTRDAATLATDMTDFQIEWGRVNAYVDAL